MKWKLWTYMNQLDVFARPLINNAAGNKVFNKVSIFTKYLNQMGQRGEAILLGYAAFGHTDVCGSLALLSRYLSFNLLCLGSWGAAGSA